MKRRILIILFLLFSLVLQAQLNLNQQVEFDYKQVSLKEFLLDIQKEYQVHFSFSRIDFNKKVNSNYKGTLSKGLQQVFHSIDISHKIIGNTITLRKAPLLNLRGNLQVKIVDADTKIELIGATLQILNEGDKTEKGYSTDVNGLIYIKGLQLKRFDFKINSLGYQEKIIPQILVNSAKDIYLEIELTPSVTAVGEVVIKARVEKFDAINQMAMNSSRAFSVEETERYAMSISDPARMVQNYAGVSHNGDDSSNDIVIRGNSPRGLLWRLEGVEIPNPNHFGDMGGKGGALSILSSATLNNSDFFTSSFPAEYGNALSGVFDLKLRKGNSNKREHGIQFNLFGVEAVTEGFFSKKTKASYLVNFRFSTLDIIKYFIPDQDDNEFNFQDASFKVFLPTKKYGSFSFFGLGGINSIIQKAVENPVFLPNNVTSEEIFERQGMGVVGISNKKVFSRKTQLHTSIALTADYQKWTIDEFGNDTSIAPLRVLHADFKNANILISSKLTHQFSTKSIFQFGLINTVKVYDNFLLRNRYTEDFTFFSNKGVTNLLQNYTQWKYRVNNKLSTNIAYHFTFLFLNNTWTIDPRFGLKYIVNNNHSLSVYMGIHSQPEHTTTYLLERNINGRIIKPNLNLKISKSYHSVLSWDFRFLKDFRLKTELYYQYLFDIPVQADVNSNYSTLNAENIYNITDGLNGKLVNKGTGRNYGLDVTIEKVFSNNYYAMFTGSLFDSYFTTFSGAEYRTNFANLYLLNLVAGKDFIVGTNKNNRIGINIKAMLNGGQRYTPIDLKKSIEKNREILVENSVNTMQFNPYYRFDLGLSYIINSKRIRHTLKLDIQNVSNKQNMSKIFFDKKTKNIKTRYQLGFIPFITYRLDFSFK